LGRSNSYTKDMMAYLKELKQDVEGISKKRNSEKFYNDAVAYIRSAYATYQLGANPKVWFTQLSSFIAATNMLDADVIARSATVSGKDVDKYCRLAWLRDNDNAAAMAQAVSTPKNAAQRAGRSALQKVRDGSTALIGKMDRLVVRKLFAACQVQVEKNGGAKVGTEENKVAAGKLLQSVILETQQNSLTTERSAAMRSGDELLKGSTMFSADAMKITARAVEAEGEARAMRYYIKKAKEAGQDAKVEELTKKLKAANKKRGRALMAIVGVALFNAALAYGFKKLYRKDDEESAATFAADTFGNMLGGIPFVRDAWGLIYDGYDVDHFLYSTFNDVLATVPASYKLLQAAANGEEVTRQQVLAHMRKVLYTTGQLTGVPVRNVYNVSTGLINRFSPETGYKIDGLIYEKNYQSDLKKALEKGDENMAAFLIGMLLGGNASDAVGNELLSLIASGYSVLPREVPDSYTYNGESVALTKAQQARVSTYYGGVSQTLEALFGSAGYQGLSAEKRAAAVESVYDAYRSEAISEATGVDIRSKREIIAKAVGTETMALMQAITSGITADKDKNGNTVDGSKRKKVVSAINAMQASPQQKLLLIAASGYRVQDGDVRGVKGDAQRVLAAYILKQRGLSATERTQLLKACGFNVVNGKVVLK
jgi:hypothetical protein